MTTQTQKQAQVPDGFTLPEWNVFQALARLGKKHNIDFVFQSPFMGGRQTRGGLVIDFLFINPPDLAINVQGEFFHQEQPPSLETGWHELHLQDRASRLSL